MFAILTIFTHMADYQAIYYLN